MKKVISMLTTQTHTIVKDLINAGVTEKQAEIMVERFVVKEELDAVEKEHFQLATKNDIIKLESKIDDVATRLESRIRELNNDISWIKVISIANFSAIACALIAYLIK